jgi:type I restriction enzyme M protein
MVGELINLISGIALHTEGAKARDLLGRVYEYFHGSSISTSTRTTERGV